MEEITIQGSSKLKIAPRSRWKKMVVPLASILFLGCSIYFYVNKSKGAIKEQQTQLENKDKIIVFLTREVARIQKEKDSEIFELKSQISEYKISKPSSLKIEEENKLLKLRLKQWQEFYENIKPRIQK